MAGRERYAMLTVDTEALPKRAPDEHVARLIWGVHEHGSAGIRELCAIGDEFRLKHVFFVDMCGLYRHPAEMREVVRWLDEQGQDVQLHMHPEVLPAEVWTENGLDFRPEYMNAYRQDDWAEFLIGHFARQLAELTGKRVLAYRAGSLRCNASSIRALRAIDIPLSFNNSMRAYRAGRCTHSEPTDLPFAWSNGVIEVPLTERKLLSVGREEETWVSLTYPEASRFPLLERAGGFLANPLRRKPQFSVALLHSWSLLHWDEHGHATFRDERRLEGYRKLRARLASEYDVITARDFVDLHARGKIPLAPAVDLARAELPA